MEQYGFFVNTDICTGCKACMTSCFDRNNLEVPQKFRKVFEFGGGEWKADEAGAFTATAFTYYVSMTCGHCENPACVANCPTGAMQKDPETGIVNNDKEKCIGCMTCEKSCPYGHPVQLDDGCPTSACSAPTRTRRARRIPPAPKPVRCALWSSARFPSCGSAIPRA